MNNNILTESALNQINLSTKPPSFQEDDVGELMSTIVFDSSEGYALKMVGCFVLHG